VNSTDRHKKELLYEPVTKLYPIIHVNTDIVRALNWAK